MPTNKNYDAYQFLSFWILIIYLKSGCNISTKGIRYSTVKGIIYVWKHFLLINDVWRIVS